MRGGFLPKEPDAYGAPGPRPSDAEAKLILERRRADAVSALCARLDDIEARLSALEP